MIRGLFPLSSRQFESSWRQFLAAIFGAKFNIPTVLLLHRELRSICILNGYPVDKTAGSCQAQERRRGVPDM
jgi:hypothetical protein